MEKLIQKIEFMGVSSYVYGEADVESNLKMQEPLEKLYEYENQNISGLTEEELKFLQSLLKDFVIRHIYECTCDEITLLKSIMEKVRCESEC